MNNEFTNKEHLKKILNDIQSFLLRHKTPKPGQKLEGKETIKLNRQQKLRLKQKLSFLHTADIAHIFEGLLPDDRDDVWAQIPAQQRGNILLSLSAPVREK